MITPGYVKMMAAYNAEMNRRLYAAADRLGDAQRRADCGAFWKSIHGTLNHIYWADLVWMSRIDSWEGVDTKLPQSSALVEDFTELTRQRVEVDGGIIAWADRVDHDWLAGDVAWYSRAVGRDMVRPRFVVVTHLFNHQTHHRGQAHALVTRFGETTGDTDLPFVLADFATD